MQLNHGIAIFVTVLATTIWLSIFFYIYGLCSCYLNPPMGMDFILLIPVHRQLLIFNPSRLFMPNYIVTLPPSS
jgi:hypothetical protein